MSKELTIAAMGDLFMDTSVLEEIIQPQLPDNVKLVTKQWPIDNLKELQRLNLLFEQQGPEAEPPPPELLEVIGDADVLITQFCPVSEQALNAAPNLKIVAVGRSGVQNVNVEAASQRGVSVLNTVGRNAQAVAEYTIGLLLCEARNIGRGHAALKNAEWRKVYPNDDSVPELPGRTLGLVGLGQIGRMVVKKMAGFEMRVIAYDPYMDPEAAKAIGVERVELPELMKQSDFISIHAKLTDETRGLISAELLALMKPTAYLINTGRAELVNENALVKILQEGKIAGAALDVFMREPPPADDPVLALDNITLSPHQGGVTADAYRTTAKLLIENISRLWAGDDLPQNLLNEETRESLAALKAEM